MSDSNQNGNYLLGVNQSEFERLRFQHTVWGPVTMKFLSRLGVREGWRCLDVGAGPGLVSFDLRDFVGKTGEVTALEPSTFYLNWFREQVTARNWDNVQCIEGTAETCTLPPRHYDLIFVRWVIAFVPDPERFLIPLIDALKVGGVLAIQDYYYEGLSLFPRGGAWDTMPDIVRAYYRSGGGDAYVTASIPAIFRKHGLDLTDFTPTCLSGGPTSGVMKWAHRFFSLHIPLMTQKGIITSNQADALMAEWNAHLQNPDALFFSPLVVDVAGMLRR